MGRNRGEISSKMKVKNHVLLRRKKTSHLMQKEKNQWVFQGTKVTNFPLYGPFPLVPVQLYNKEKKNSE